MPQDATVDKVTRNSQEISFDATSQEYTQVGFLVELPPRQTTELRIDYTLSQTLSAGHSSYQLIVQKQPGIPNTDFTLEVLVPQGVKVGGSNISAVVKEGRIFYNTSLSSDKVFVLELTR